MPDSANRLFGWKQIAEHFGKDQRTVQLWEKKRGLPVHRVPGEKNLVWADPAELTHWLNSGASDLPPSPAATVEPSEQTPTPIQPSPPPPPKSNRTLILAISAVLLAAVALGLTWRFQPTPVPTVPKLPPDRLFALALTDPKVVRSLPIQGTLVGISLSPGDEELFLLGGSTSSLIVVDPNDLERQTQVPLGDIPISTAHSRALKRLYIGTNHGSVLAYNRTSRSISTLLSKLPGRVTSIALTPDETMMFLALERGGLYRYQLQTKQLDRIDGVACPEHLDIDAAGSRLFISQQCGTGGQPGRDSIQIHTLPGLTLATQFKGMPFVGGPIFFHPATNRLWADAFDACGHYPANRADCPAFPARVAQVFDLLSNKLSRSITYPNSNATPSFSGDLVILTGDPIRVLNAATYALREALPLPEGARAVIDTTHRKLYTLDLNGETAHLNAIPFPDPACSPSKAALYHQWPFDGYGSDWVTGLDFPDLSPSLLIPGIVGQAVNLTASQLRATADHDIFAPTTWSLWVRWTGGEGGTLIEARHGNLSWTLQVTDTAQVAYRDSQGAIFTAPAVLKPATWTHIALTRTGSSVSLAINGAPERTIPTSNLVHPENNTLTLGSFPGAIDELLAYIGPLDNATLQTILAQPKCNTQSVR